MILVLGSSADRVYPTLLRRLDESGHPYIAVDEDHPEEYGIRREWTGNRWHFHIEGRHCGGGRSVNAIFVRHAVARTLNAHHLERMGALQRHLNAMLLAVECPVINRPSASFSNYSKPYQLELLSSAGFDVPKSLMTNMKEEAYRFYEEFDGQVVFKGVSNVLTLVQVLRPEKMARLDLLPHCPTLFQEYVAGDDYRVHVVGDRTFVTRLAAQDEDYRRSALMTDEEVIVEAASLPDEILSKCVALTRSLGLTVSGIDFKESPRGRLVALECNPFPQFTFYEGRSGQPITEAVVEYLINNATDETNVYV
jgi:glutathione synthase/RimK-type ligase-like ATP-grasp enzyme